MSFLGDIAKLVREYLRTRGENPLVQVQGGYGLYTKLPKIQVITRELLAYEERTRPAWLESFFSEQNPISPLLEPPPDVEPQDVEIFLPDYEHPDGRMAWQEVWTFPSNDFEALCTRDAFYAVPGYVPVHRIELTDRLLYLYLEVRGQQLSLQLPLNHFAWGAIRPTFRAISDIARHCGVPFKEIEREFIAIHRAKPVRCRVDGRWEYLHPDPERKQYLWSVRITKQSPLGEILTNLVVMARLGGVPVAEEDDQEALTWVRSVMQRAYGRWVLNLEAREQLVDDLLSAVYEAVLTRFDLPDTNQSLQRFIFITAQGLAKDLYKKARRMYLAELMHGDTDGEISQDDADDVGDESDKSKPGQGWGRRLEPFGYQLEPWVDPSSGGRLYPPSVVVDHLLVRDRVHTTERRVYRWMTEHGYTSAPNGHQAFSEDQLAEFRQALLREQKEELQRQALMQYQIETLRKSEAAAKQFIQRAKKNGESLEEMTRNLIISGRGRGRKS